MIRFALITSFLLFGLGAFAQPGYTDFSKTDGLKISTKWGKAKDESGEKKPALLISTLNENEHAVAYSFEILLYYEGILRERGVIENQCLDKLRSSIGKLNGIFFIPQNFTEDQLKNKDFNFTIESVEVEQVDACE